MLSNVDASESLIENENEVEINEDIELMIAVGIQKLTRKLRESD